MVEGQDAADGPRFLHRRPHRHDPDAAEFLMTPDRLEAPQQHRRRPPAPRGASCRGRSSTSSTAAPRTSGRSAGTSPPSVTSPSCRRRSTALRRAICRSRSSAIRLKMPVMIGPTALQGLFWPDGERAAARAAIAAGTGYALSHGSVCTMEVLAETGIAPRFMQIFVYRDRSFTHEFIDRAAAAGYQGLILTIDNQLGGNRERDLRNGFTIPPKLGPKQVGAMAVKVGVGVADAQLAPRPQLRQLCAERQAARLPLPRGPGRRDVRHRHVVVRRRRHPQALEGDVPPERPRPPGRGAPRGRARRRRHRRLQPRRTAARRHDQFDRGAAARGRRGRRPHSGADRRRHSAAAPTWSRRSALAPAPSSSAGRISGASRSAAKPAWRGSSKSTGARSTG